MPSPPAPPNPSPLHRQPRAAAGWRLGAALAAAVCLLAAWPAVAQRVDYPHRRGSFTPGELAVLPPYCSNMQGFAGYKGPEGDRWRAMMGPDFQHIHHYCRRLRDVYYITYSLPTPVQRQFLWSRAIGEYDYMIKNSLPTMPLLPEIFFRRGEALVKLGRLPEAEESFANARMLKPDYWPPYAAWADQLIKLKLYERAQALLQLGLGHLPGHPQLLDRLAKLPDGAELVAQARSDHVAAETAAAKAAAEKAAAAAADNAAASAPAARAPAASAPAATPVPASAPASAAAPAAQAF